MRGACHRTRNRSRHGRAARRCSAQPRRSRLDRIGIDALREVGLALRLVHGGIGGGIDDDVGLAAGDGGSDADRVRRGRISARLSAAMPYPSGAAATSARPSCPFAPVIRIFMRTDLHARLHRPAACPSHPWPKGSARSRPAATSMPTSGSSHASECSAPGVIAAAALVEKIRAVLQRQEAMRKAFGHPQHALVGRAQFHADPLAEIRDGPAQVDRHVIDRAATPRAPACPAGRGSGNACRAARRFANGVVVLHEIDVQPGLGKARTRSSFP